jgi:spore germination cell wall hydrolase CwlJ-like protein
LAGVAFAGILVNGIIQRELNPNEPVQYNVPASISEEYQVEDPVEIPVSPEWVDTNVVSGLENKVNTNVPARTNSAPINSGKTKVAYTDVELLGKLIYGEARSCSDTEKIAVAYTALNRVSDGDPRNGDTLREVILKPYQYSCFNSKDPNSAKIRSAHKNDPQVYRECLEIAEKVLSGKYKDPTNGAINYHTNNIAKKPDWARKLDRIGRLKTENGLSAHIFYRG